MIVNLPFKDDYDILSFLLHQRTLPSLPARTVYAVTVQHNEYKLILENLLITIQFIWLGHISFSTLCVIGDSAVALLAIVLWKMFLPDCQDLALRLSLFIPVSWLLFQLSYAETLNWTLASIQNLFVPVFALSSFALLARNTRRTFAASLIFLVLAIMASGNGFIAVFVGALLLLSSRRWLHLAVWLGTAACMVLLYAYHYDVLSSQSGHGRSIFATFLHLNFLYVLSFLGSLGAFIHVVPAIPALAGSVALGSLLLAFFLFESRRKHLTAYPAVILAVLFILFTGVGVAGLRSELGSTQSLAVRYRIYSSLALALAWFIVSEKYLQHSRRPLWRNHLYLVGVTFAVLLSLMFDRSGLHYFRLRNAMLIDGMSLYEHPDARRPLDGPLILNDPHFAISSIQENQEDRRILRSSAEAGIYQPPSF